MSTPALRRYPSEAEYRLHYEQTYCTGDIKTFDGITVRFNKSQFDHCFYESSQRNRVKDTFSIIRAERIDWIKATLENPNADLYQGWNNRENQYSSKRRVCVVYNDYVVVIEISDDSLTAKFTTAFVADNSIGKIKISPVWTP